MTRHDSNPIHEHKLSYLFLGDQVIWIENERIIKGYGIGR